MENKRFTIAEKILFLFIIILMISIALITMYQGSTDVGDYADTAKFFAGKYSADIRSSHSYLFGAIHSLFLQFSDNFFMFKITGIIFLLATIYSVYRICNRRKEAFWLILLSPIIWYMAPWINPIQISGFFFLWAYYFIKKYNKEEKISSLVLSGIFLGLSWGFWDAVIFFAAIFIISFFYNKNIYYLLLFLISVAVGLMPRLILDQFLFGFAFLGIIRYFFGVIASTLYNGVYGDMNNFNPLKTIIMLLILPIFTYKLFSKNFIKSHKDLFIFFLLSFLLLLMNSQIRYTLLIIPLIIIELIPILSKKQYKISIIISLILLLLVIFPYLIQIKNSTNVEEVTTLLLNINNITFFQDKNQILIQDINKIYEEFPSENYLVGPNSDDFQILAHLYWGEDIKEFISIQDYQLWKENRTILFEKIFSPAPKINERRQIWIAGGISKNINDKTDFSSITYAIGVGAPINEEGFQLIKRYSSLYLFKKYKI